VTGRQGALAARYNRILCSLWNIDVFSLKTTPFHRIEDSMF
jgi:hypothetical protein